MKKYFNVYRVLGSALEQVRTNIQASSPMDAISRSVSGEFYDCKRLPATFKDSMTGKRYVIYERTLDGTKFVAVVNKCGDLYNGN